MNINVEIKLFAQYREGRFKSKIKAYSGQIDIKKIVTQLGLDKQSPIGVLMVNSRHVDEDYILKDGDIVALFPKIGGG